MKKLIILALFISAQLCVAQEDLTRGYRVKVGEHSPKLDFNLLVHTNYQ